MAPKRPLEDDTPSDSSKFKKHRSGFKVGPDNLPDGTWRRKVIKIKKELIKKSKIKKSYAKIKAKEPPIDRPIIPDQDPLAEKPCPPRAGASEKVVAEAATPTLHPDRQSNLSRPRSPTPPAALPSAGPRAPNPNTSHPGFPLPLAGAPGARHQKRAPKYFAKEEAIAARARAEAEARREERERRRAEKEARLRERERLRRRMAEARRGGRNGGRRLGRESAVLLERVRRVVGAT